MRNNQKNHIFSHLKRKFILTSVLSSSLVLLVAFSSIYIIVSNNLGNRPPLKINFEPAKARETTKNRPSPSEETTEDNNNFQLIFENQLKSDREKSLEILLVSLIVTGISLEILIAVVSFFLAEQSIKPVREAYEAQKSFIANASHEIKTPLAVIQANLEAADIKGNHWLDNVAKKTEDLANLNAQLLTLARMDSTTSEQKLEEIDLLKTVKTTVDCFLPKSEKKHINIKIKPKNSGKIRKTINRADFEQLLNILIDNAVKYGKEYIKIDVSTTKTIIKNDGQTIKKEDLKHIFNRFYQTDKSKSGVGLGLAIAKQLADNNNWKLIASSDEKQKTTSFTIEY